MFRAQSSWGAPWIALTLVCAGLLAGCATTQHVPELRVERGRAVAAVAVSLLGTPYRFGGTDARGFDCSGLAVFAHERAGISIPRTAAEQKRAARPVPLETLLPGDLVFFRIGARHVNHVGVYVGHGRFIHAPRSDALVTYGSLINGYYRKHIVSAGRFW